MTSSSEGFSFKTLCCGSCGDMNCHLVRFDWCDAETTPLKRMVVVDANELSRIMGRIVTCCDCGKGI